MTDLLGIASPAQTVLGFDTVTTVSSSMATAMVAKGYGFCARYLKRSGSIDAPTSGPALTIAEAKDLLAAGLAIVPVQFGLSSLLPSATAGSDVGEAAATNASALGIPRGVTLWCDLEWSPEVSPDPAATIRYANAWHDAVVDAGWRAGLYVGPNIPLDAVQLGDLAFTSYWKSASRVPTPTPRGYQMVQRSKLPVDGIELDTDIACMDAEGDRFTWLTTNPDTTPREAKQ